jgi:hypothetical protein
LPPISSLVHPNTAVNAGFTPSSITIPFGSTAIRKLGIASVIASTNPRRSSASRSRALRSVMSRPPATMLITRPCSSSTGALRQKMTRRSPRAFVNSFSYSLGGKSGAAARKRSIISSRSSGSMNTSQKYFPRSSSSVE